MPERRGEGESVATMWGRMLAEVQDGPPIVLEDKFGNEIAVMMSKDHYDALVSQIAMED